MLIGALFKMFLKAVIVIGIIILGFMFFFGGRSNQTTPGYYPESIQVVQPNGVNPVRDAQYAQGVNVPNMQANIYLEQARAIHEQVAIDQSLTAAQVQVMLAQAKLLEAQACDIANNCNSGAPQAVMIPFGEKAVLTLLGVVVGAVLMGYAIFGRKH